MPPPPRHAPSEGEEKSADAQLAKKQKAMIVRAEKKQLLSKLHEDHNIDISFLLLAFKKFRDKDNSNTYQLNFDLFCEILQIEPIGEYVVVVVVVVITHSHHEFTTQRCTHFRVSYNS